MIKKQFNSTNTLQIQCQIRMPNVLPDSPIKVCYKVVSVFDTYT